MQSRSNRLQTKYLGDKGAEEEKPKVKEAQSIKLPDFPNPETYRSWKIATREAV